jgi:ATP-dependent RNA helicase DDX35
MVPEIQRSNMARVIVQLKALGVDNILRFPFISPPPAENMLHGIELLSSLGAIDDRCQLTIPLGMTMAEFPLDPMYTKVLLSSEEFGCSEEVLTIAAILQIENVFIAAPNQRKQAERCKRKFAAAQGDHISMLNVYNAFLQYNRSSRWCQTNLLHYKGLCRAVEIRTQLERLLRKTIGNLASCNGDVEVIQKCITNGLFANAARLHPSGEYRTVRNDYALSIHPTSVLYVEKPPDWLVFGDVVHTKKEYMRDVTVIKPEWLYELAPQYYQFGTERELAAKRARLH